MVDVRNIPESQLKPVRVVCYGRVSTKEQTKKFGLPSQVEEMKKYCERNGFEIVEIITEDISGAVPMYLRPEGKRIYDLLSSVDIILTHEKSRIARDEKEYPLDFFNFLRDVEEAGCELHTVLDGKIIGNIKDIVDAWSDSKERKDKRERTMRGKQEAIRQGKLAFGGLAPYGYQVVIEGREKRFEIIEEQAQIVRFIFDAFVNKRWGVSQIVRDLTDRGELTPGDIQGRKKKRGTGVWSADTVYRILHNASYIGKHELFKLSFRKGRNGEITKIAHDKSEWQSVEVPVIIDKELYYEAQKMITGGKRGSIRNTHYEYLVGRKIACNRCGYSVRAQHTENVVNGKLYAYSYYQCQGELGQTAGDCDMPHFRSDVVDHAVWQWVRSLITDIEFVRNEYKRLQAKKEGELQPLKNRLAGTQRDLAENKERLKKAIVGFVNSQGYTKEIFEEEQNRLEKAVSSGLEEIESLEKLLNEAHITDDRIERITNFVRKYTRFIDAADMSFKVRRRIIEVFNVNVRIDVVDGQKKLYVSCDLGESTLDVKPIEPVTLDEMLEDLQYEPCEDMPDLEEILLTDLANLSSYLISQQKNTLTTIITL